MTKSEQTTNRIIGTMTSAGGGTGTVRMRDRFDTNIDDLWSALTTAPRLARWIAEVSGDLRLGGEFRAAFTSGWEGVGQVVVCEPPRRLLVTMGLDQQDPTEIEAELLVDGDQTIMVIQERGLALGELADHGAGWQAHVEHLTALVAGEEHSDWATRWRELTTDYRDMVVQQT